MKKYLMYCLIAFYVLFVMIVTIMLFTFNKFSNSVIGGHTIIGLDKEFKQYKSGDLLIVKNSTNIKKGDKILFYDTNERKNFLNEELVVRVIKTNEKETTYEIRDNEYLSGEYVISTTNHIKRIPMLGYFYILATSKMGYLLFIIVPIVAYFVTLLKRSGYVKKKD